ERLDRRRAPLVCPPLRRPRHVLRPARGGHTRDLLRRQRPEVRLYVAERRPVVRRAGSPLLSPRAAAAGRTVTGSAQLDAAQPRGRLPRHSRAVALRRATTSGCTRRPSTSYCPSCSSLSTRTSSWR